jgi:hypothetical protein
LKLRLLLVAGTLVLAAACATKRIPGTDIEDNSSTRAILGVMERYRAALEARDAAAIQGLMSPTFVDDAGTQAPDDDLTYATVPRELPARLAKLEDVKLDLSVRRIVVKDDRAAAIYYWNASFRTPRLTNRQHRESELEQMLLQREDGVWKIVSGI